MTRHLAVVSLLAVALSGAACAKTGMEPTPQPTPTPGLPQGWTGTMTATTSAVDSQFPDAPPFVVTATGTVTWQKNPTPPRPSEGFTSYAVTAGEMTLTANGSPCGFAGQTRYNVTPWGPGGTFPSANTLDVRSDGFFTGWVDQTTTLPVTVAMHERCHLPPTMDLEEIGMSEDFTGSLANGHVKGTITERDAVTTRTVSWDFAPR